LAPPSCPARTTRMRSESATTAGRCSCPTTPAASSAASRPATTTVPAPRGTSAGQELVVPFAGKPTSSILIPRRSIDRFGNEIEVVTKGRHDPCVGIRAVPVGEAMLAIVLADHLLRQRALVGTLGSARSGGGGAGVKRPSS